MTWTFDNFIRNIELIFIRNIESWIDYTTIVLSLLYCGMAFYVIRELKKTEEENTTNKISK